MASSIAAITTGTGGVVTTADATGNLNLLSGTTTIVAVTSTGAAVTGTLSASGAATLSSTLGVTGVATLGTGAILGTPASGTLTNCTGLPQAGLAAGVAGNGPAFSAYLNSVQAILNNVSTKITFDAEVFDTNTNFASSRFTPTVAGYYQIVGAAYWTAGSQTSQVVVYKNGVAFSYGPYLTGQGAAVSALVSMNGSTDYVEIYIYLTGSTTTLYANQAGTYFIGFMARSA